MDYDKKTLQQSGIYAIVQLKTGRMYVGQTGSRFVSRWRLHRGELNRGTHPCRPLQWDWIFFGADNFEFRILENIGRGYGDYALHREAVYISRAESIYNTRMPAAHRFDLNSLLSSKYARLPPHICTPIPSENS